MPCQVRPLAHPGCDKSQHRALREEGDQALRIPGGRDPGNYTPAAHTMEPTSLSPRSAGGPEGRGQSPEWKAWRSCGGGRPFACSGSPWGPYYTEEDAPACPGVTEIQRSEMGPSETEQIRKWDTRVLSADEARPPAAARIVP